MCSGQISVILLSIEHMHIRLRLTRNVKFLSYSNRFVFRPLDLNPVPDSTSSRFLFLPQTLPHALPYSLLERLGIFPPHPGRLHVGRALVVRAAQHANNTKEDRLGGLNGRPSF